MQDVEPPRGKDGLKFELPDPKADADDRAADDVVAEMEKVAGAPPAARKRPAAACKRPAAAAAPSVALKRPAAAGVVGGPTKLGGLKSAAPLVSIRTNP